VRQDAHGGREFVVVYKNTAGVDYDIVVTRRDIEKIQLAKAAIRTGINVRPATNISENEIDEVIIAGAFGIISTSTAQSDYLFLLSLKSLEGGKCHKQQNWS
jgi:uncharacterized 2Fe-2S/4Fe-4S cluster protein (DUF4445 family)